MLGTDAAPGSNLPHPLYAALTVGSRLKRFGVGIALPKGSDLSTALNPFIQQARKSGGIDRMRRLTGRKP